MGQGLFTGQASFEMGMEIPMNDSFVSSYQTILSKKRFAFGVAELPCIEAGDHDSKGSYRVVMK